MVGRREGESVVETVNVSLAIHCGVVVWREKMQDGLLVEAGTFDLFGAPAAQQPQDDCGESKGEGGGGVCGVGGDR